MFDLFALAQECAPQIHPDTLRRVVEVESSYNPYAIGVVGGRLQRQPRSLSEAVATAKSLDAAGHNFSVGLAQVNKQNFTRFGLTLESAFNPCENLRVGAAILAECFDRARRSRDSQSALRAALSCYYSGNFSTGFREGYVGKIEDSERARSSKTIWVPALTASANTVGNQRARPIAPISQAPSTRAKGVRFNNGAVAPTEGAETLQSALIF